MMQADETILLLRKYRSMISGIEARSDPQALTIGHLAYMIETLVQGIELRSFSEQKTMRWLGWIQCLLALHNVRTMLQMREDNR